MSLMDELADHYERKKLAGKRVVYRARWSDDDRVGTISRINGNIVWIGVHCFHRTDIVRLAEAK